MSGTSVVINYTAKSNHDKPWTCINCYTLNKAEFLDCVNCMTRRKGVGKLTIDELGNHQTLSKRPSLADNMMCKVKNIFKPKPSWTCPQCTVEVIGQRKECHICGAQTRAAGIEIDPVDMHRKRASLRPPLNSHLEDSYSSYDIISPSELTKRGGQNLEEEPSPRFPLLSQPQAEDCPDGQTISPIRTPPLTNEDDLKLATPLTANGSAPQSPLGPPPPPHSSHWVCSLCGAFNFIMEPEQRCYICNIGVIPTTGEIPPPLGHQHSRQLAQQSHSTQQDSSPHASRPDPLHPPNLPCQDDPPRPSNLPCQDDPPRPPNLPCQDDPPHPPCQDDPPRPPYSHKPHCASKHDPPHPPYPSHPEDPPHPPNPHPSSHQRDPPRPPNLPHQDDPLRLPYPHKPHHASKHDHPHPHPPNPPRWDNPPYPHPSSHQEDPPNPPYPLSYAHPYPGNTLHHWSSYAQPWNAPSPANIPQKHSTAPLQNIHPHPQNSSLGTYGATSSLHRRAPSLNTGHYNSNRNPDANLSQEQRYTNLSQTSLSRTNLSQTNLLQGQGRTTISQTNLSQGQGHTNTSQTNLSQGRGHANVPQPTPSQGQGPSMSQGHNISQEQRHGANSVANHHGKLSGHGRVHRQGPHSEQVPSLPEKTDPAYYSKTNVPMTPEHILRPTHLYAPGQLQQRTPREGRKRKVKGHHRQNSDVGACSPLDSGNGMGAKSTQPVQAIRREDSLEASQRYLLVQQYCREVSPDPPSVPGVGRTHGWWPVFTLKLKEKLPLHLNDVIFTSIDLLIVVLLFPH